MKLHTISQDGPLYKLRGHRLKFPKKIIFLSLKIDYAAFHLGLHCLPKYSLSLCGTIPQMNISMSESKQMSHLIRVCNISQFQNKLQVQKYSTILKLHLSPGLLMVALQY